MLDELLNDLSKKTGGKFLDVESPIASCISVNSDPVEIAAKLYNLRVTGPRGIKKTDHFGNCYLGTYTHDYIVMNAAIGVRTEDIVNSVSKLEKILL